MDELDINELDIDNEKSILKLLLSEGVVNITFTKKDGTNRVMKSTLKSDKIPQSDAPKSDKPPRVKSEETQAVYDLENEGWRSFRWDSLVDYQVVIEDLGDK